MNIYIFSSYCHWGTIGIVLKPFLFVFFLRMYVILCNILVHSHVLLKAPSRLIFIVWIHTDGAGSGAVTSAVVIDVSTSEKVLSVSSWLSHARDRAARRTTSVVAPVVCEFLLIISNVLLLRNSVCAPSWMCLCEQSRSALWAMI